MSTNPSRRTPVRPIPRRLVVALLAYADPVRVLEVTGGPPVAASACAKLGIAHAAEPGVTYDGQRAADPDELPDLIVLTAPRARVGSRSPMFDAQFPVSVARLLLAPTGILAVWIPTDGNTSTRPLGIVLGALPRRRLAAIWAHPEGRQPQEGHMLPTRANLPCSYLVLFRSPPAPGTGFEA